MSGPVVRCSSFRKRRWKRPAAHASSVAWSDTRESARALRDALLLLRRAEAVEVLRFASERVDEAAPLDAMAAYLGVHGVRAQCTVRALREPRLAERMPVPNAVDASVRELLLSAADINADLIVMGGYDHPRAYQLVLGGVTRTMLGSMTCRC